MDPLAAITAAPAPTIPAAWIQSGAITPVVTSPVATNATAWVPEPVVAAPQSSTGVGLVDAIADAIATPVATPAAVAAPVAAAPASASVADAQLAQQQLALQATVATPSPSAAAGAQALPPVVAAPVAVASAPVTAPAAAVADPTATSSISGALAGFASATGRVIAEVAGAGASKAKRVGNELWAGVRNPKAIHVSQVASKYNKAPASGNRDCGPASVVMTLKLLGKQIPGAAASASPQKLINRVRQLAGNTANGASTTNHELEQALTASGTKVREIADAASVKRAVLAGKPVILNGNPGNAGAYGKRFSAAQMTPFNGAHWILVSGYDAKAGTFIINDPLSKVGPVKVTPAQLEAYRGGSMGIEVAA